MFSNYHWNFPIKKEEWADPSPILWEVSFNYCLNGYFFLKNSTHLHSKVFFHTSNGALFTFPEFLNYFKLLSPNYFVNTAIYRELTATAKTQNLFWLFIIFDFYLLLAVLLSLKLAFLFLCLFLSAYFGDPLFFVCALVLFYRMFSFAFS